MLSCIAGWVMTVCGCVCWHVVFVCGYAVVLQQYKLACVAPMNTIKARASVSPPGRHHAPGCRELPATCHSSSRNSRMSQVAGRRGRGSASALSRTKGVTKHQNALIWV